MPQIDLEPDQYRHFDPKTGRMVREMKPRHAFWMMVVALAILGFIFWTRNEGSRETLFGVSAMFAFFAGIFFANWLRNVY